MLLIAAHFPTRGGFLFIYLLSTLQEVCVWFSAAAMKQEELLWDSSSSLFTDLKHKPAETFLQALDKEHQILMINHSETCFYFPSVTLRRPWRVNSPAETNSQKQLHHFELQKLTRQGQVDNQAVVCVQLVFIFCCWFSEVSSFCCCGMDFLYFFISLDKTLSLGHPLTWARFMIQWSW